ncbi:hypothetical protein A2572_03655 [Candidatus Collierbacteria bacterium RIFOXYD1_FULL_40_9]|uniref:Uncharacterized protein n=1 Tax=Candidatus Collierbacteria bacterium RIFOXYD1_FULL_40_9 TaxID=1817731 RepID=A0A1F5FTK1_9BACT|nr:MAG: hypothetical protein A2572_03655 [Candidatus Collierbacteria bacterium RIFOXYD1_FULL_40_9]
MNDVLQVPMSKELREKATIAALAQGYSSLQETVRIFLTQLAEKKIETAFIAPIKLSAKNEKRYQKILDDAKTGKNITSFASVDDFLDYVDQIK